MTADEKWAYLVELDESLLKGGAVLSEWTTVLVRNTDLAFVGEANLAAIITALAAIETHLRGEGGNSNGRLIRLIAEASMEEDLRGELTFLRKYRNKWVHISEPWDDENLIQDASSHEVEIEEVAKRSLLALRRVIYSGPLV
jgi:hypothetical protein